jgi:leucyl aminopeptidase
LEALRALAHGNFTPTTPVEFHYYSAEEGGLLGSQAVAKSYEDGGKKVLAMLQMDMTGMSRRPSSRPQCLPAAWVKKGTKESVGIIQDFVDPDLTDFIFKTVEEYRTLLSAPFPHVVFRHS